MDDIVPRSLFLLALLLCGGFFAGSETALSYCNRVRIQVLADDGDASAERVLNILDHFDRAVVTLLIAINITYTLSASVATMLAVSLMGDAGSVVATILTTLAVFLCCETIPKNFARANADAYLLRVSAVLHGMMIVLYPLSMVLSGLGNLARSILSRHTAAQPSVSEDELASIVTDAAEDGVIDHEESDIIKSAIDFGDIRASEVMLPLEKMVCIPLDIDNDSLRRMLIDEKYSRIPVYVGNMDHIVGFIRSVRCLWRLLNDSSFKLRENLYRTYIVKPDMLISQVFEGMSRRRSHIAIVQDEDGHTVGMLTMEDILEEIVGEIYDEDDSNADTRKEALQ